MRVRIIPFRCILCIFVIMPLMLAPAHSAGIMSQYGQIQNVQNYSTNPFWSPDGPYNQRMPSPVYVTGPDVKDDDCQTVVAALIAAQCVARNNCENTRLTDIRPAIMMDLARLPGHNYASACAGYIDGAFDSYKNNNAYTVQPTAFPVATQPATEQQPTTIDTQTVPTSKTPAWKKDIQERSQELKRLQAANGAGTEKIAKADFPQTINDVSFQARTQNLAAGYAPYKDAKAYMGIELESKEKAIERQKNLAAAERELFCTRNPSDPTCSGNTGGNTGGRTEHQMSKDQVIEMIAAALKTARN